MNVLQLEKMSESPLNENLLETDNYYFSNGDEVPPLTEIENFTTELLSKELTGYNLDRLIEKDNTDNQNTKTKEEYLRDIMADLVISEIADKHYVYNDENNIYKDIPYYYYIGYIIDRNENKIKVDFIWSFNKDVYNKMVSLEILKSCSDGLSIKDDSSIEDQNVNGNGEEENNNYNQEKIKKEMMEDINITNFKIGSAGSRARVNRYRENLNNDYCMCKVISNTKVAYSQVVNIVEKYASQIGIKKFEEISIETIGQLNFLQPINKEFTDEERIIEA